MSLETADVIAFMQAAYRQGALDKFMRVLGRSLFELMDETGVTFETLVYKLDEAGGEAIRKFEGSLTRAGGLMRLAARDGIMRVASRVLDVAAVARLLTLALKAALMILIAKSDGSEHPVSDTLGGYLSGAREKIPVRITWRRGG